MKNIYIICAVLFIFCDSATLADHILKRSDTEALRAHKYRMGGLINKFQTEIIPGSTSPLVLKDKSEPNAEIRKMINETDLLSVLFYDGSAITVNELSSKKLGELGKMYSMSIAKSYVGYLTGHALCDGVIKKLDDPIGSYVPETKGTLYEGVSIRSMINMSAGDSSYFGDKYTLTAYGLPIMVEGKSIKSMLEGSRGISRSDNAGFYYSNILPDIIARAIHLNVHSGIANYFYTKIANRAKTASEMIFLKDKNNWQILFASLYVTRMDFLRFGILISSEWKSATCIGSYLKNLYDKRVNTGQKMDGFSAQGYGGFFWMNKENLSFPHLQMRGHGGQRITINLETGAILAIHAIRKNFDSRKLERIFFN